MRGKCLKSERTHRVSPERASEAERSDRLEAAAVMLYLLGVSYRGVEVFLTALGFDTDRVTRYRAIHEAGKKARHLRHEWLKQAGRIRLIGSNPTNTRCGGEDAVVGVTFKAQVRLPAARSGGRRTGRNPGKASSLVQIMDQRRTLSNGGERKATARS